MVMKKTRIVPVKIILPLSIFSITMLMSYHLYVSSSPYKVTVLLFLSIVFFERLWEAFFTPSDRKTNGYEGDWTAPLVLSAYSMMFISIISDFFYFKRELNIIITCIGVFFFFSSFFFRWWAIFTMGDQWAINIFSKSNSLKEEKLILKGPYTLVRHPIYLAYLIEIVSLQLIINTYYTLFVVFFLQVPIQLIRIKFEEEGLLNKFGSQYRNYMKSVRALLPLPRNVGLL